MEKLELAQADVAIGVSYSVQVGDGKNLVLQTHYPRDASPDGFNALLDKLHYSGERQVIYGKLDQLKLELERADKMENDLRKAIDRIDSEQGLLPQRGHRAAKLDAAKDAERNNSLKNLEFLRVSKAEFAAKVVELLNELKKSYSGE